jgi:putative ABC transport system ATP-binding protein
MLSNDTQTSQGSTEADERTLAVSCRGVIRDFGVGPTQTRVLHGIDLDIAFGDQTFLVGPSGCGKTTLVSLIAGLLTPTSGRICVLGEDLQRLSPASLVEFRARNIGFIFQQFNLIPALNAVENAAVPLVVQGRSLSAAVKLAAIVLDRLGMGNYLTYFPWQLSGGQQQRVAIARSLVHNPRIIICDEPTAALDAKSGLAVMALLTELAASPERAVIIVTHDTRIFSYADRTISLMDGRIEASPSTDGQAHS